MKKKHIWFLVSSLIFISSCSIFTDNDDDDVIKFIETFCDYSSKGFSLDVTNDKGYVITGYYNDGVLLLKTDKNGNEKWCKSLGEASDAWGRCVVQTEDSGYIVTGNLTEESLYVVKTDINGNIEWNLTYDGGFGYDVIQTNDGGYIVLGSLSGNPWLIKINEYGFEEWNKIFGEINLYGNECSIAQTDDGGYIIIGGSSIIKTDELGYEVWSNTISSGTGYEVKQTDDGGYIIAGTSETGGGDIWLAKIYDFGNIVWERTFGGTEFDEGRSVDITDDGGYIITGTTRNISEDSYNIWLIKTNEIGIEEWNKIFGGINVNDYSEGCCVRQTNDGGYVLTGKINNQACLIKTDDEGNIE